MPYRKSTLRKMPPHTRRVARLLNELEGTWRKLRNTLDALQTLELYARASMKATAVSKEEESE